LRARLQRDRQLPVDEAVGIVRTIAGALDYAHRHGVVHRDLKPENILLQDGQPLVADFGISLAVTNAADARLTATSKAIGTPQYMSPEQVTVDAGVDGRSDIYSLGCVLYELLVGEPPFTGGTTQDVIARVLAERPTGVRELRPDVPAHVEIAIARALSKLPADRFATAREFADAIGLAPISVRGGRTAWWRDPARMFLGAAAIVALVTAVWMAFTSPPPVRTRLAVLPLENRTTDPALEEWGEYAADMLTRRIDLAARVDVIPASTVRDAIRALGATPAPSAAAVAKRTGASHVLTGSMAGMGGSIRIDVEIVDARSVKRLLSPDPISGPTDSLEAVIDRLAERTAAASLALFEPRPSWMGGYTLPTTIAMYRDYNATFQLFCHSRYSEVITTGNRVLEKSPDFIPIMGLVRFAYWNVGRTTEADSVHVRLEQLRDRMTASERVEHDWMGGLIDGDTSLTARSAEEMFQIDPSSKYGFAAGFTAFRMRRLEDALQRFLAADMDLPCQSAWFPWWNYTAAAYHLLDRFEDEVRLAQRASARFAGRSQLYDMELRAAAATSRYGALDSILARVADLPPPPPGGLAFGRLATNVALELRAHGEGEHADRFIQRALEWFASRSPSEYRFERGLAFIAAGLWADADTLFSGVVRDAPATDNPTYIGYLGYSGVALANLGRRDDALEWSRRLERITGRPVLTSYGTAARAAIAAALGDGDGAIRLLNDAFQHGYPYDIFMHQSPWWDPLRKMRDFEALVRPK
ncbi:MAG: protein kinase domain-containing protein, partial [Longimicrobiales bacterium]